MDSLTSQFKEALTKNAPGVYEITEVVKTFRFFHNHNDYIVQVLDSGDVSDNSRYYLLVYLDGKRVGRGNGGRTITEAVQVFHWNALDNPS